MPMQGVNTAMREETYWVILVLVGGISVGVRTTVGVMTGATFGMVTTIGKLSWCAWGSRTMGACS